MTYQNFENLIVWQKAMQLTMQVYKSTALIPFKDGIGLIDQMRRAALSIPSNIAEGKSRKTKKEYAWFIRIALGSTYELETQNMIKEKIFPHTKNEQINNLLIEIRKMLCTMHSKLYAP